MTANTTKTDPTQRTYSKGEYDAALEIAKGALRYVADFQTPPTPEVYEVWFRFAEGNNPELKEQLEYAVKELKTVDRKRIEQLHHQFFARAELKDTNADLTNSLASEMGSFESMIQSQIAIGNDFDAAVSAAGENLQEKSDADEVRNLVETVVATSESMRRELGKLRSELESSLAKVDSLREEFQESQKNLLSDPLTGVGNRRLFDTLIRQSVEDGPDPRTYRLLMLIDLDNFKDINDTFGHAAGDEVLRFVAFELQQLAPDASITRYGGDEFAMFVDCDSPSRGEALANEMRDYFTKNQLTMKKTGNSLGTVTLSIGVSVLREHDTCDSWFGRADKLLYTAKSSGRNRVYSEQKLD
jgi:diguanylate cyclase